MKTRDMTNLLAHVIDDFKMSRVGQEGLGISRDVIM